MNIFEKSTKENKSIIDSITEILNDDLNIDVSNESVSEIVKNMTLSDFIEIDTAIQNKDIDYIKNKFLDNDEVNEYAMQGRKSVTSSASARPKPDKVSEPVKVSQPTSSTNNTSSQDNKDDTGNSSSGSLSPSEYAEKQKIDKEIEELEKMRKMAGLS
jgi:hypothetical protein